MMVIMAVVGISLATGCGSGSSDSSNSNNNVAPATPTGLMVTDQTTNISLSWNASTGASGYNLYRSASSSGTFTVIANNISGTTYTDSAVAGNTTYYYEVSAKNSYGESPLSSYVSGTSGAPLITGFSPTSGTVGTSVTITGTNFSTIAANNTVKFNGTTATVSSATMTSIVTSVPTGATTGTISLTTSNGTTTSISSFTVGGVVTGSGMKVTVGGTLYTFTNITTNWTNTSGVYVIVYSTPSTTYPMVSVGVTTGVMSVVLYKTASDTATYAVATSAFTISGSTVTAINWTGTQSGTCTGTLVGASLTAVTYP